MDPDTCLVTTVGSLDAESQSQFTLRLTATDAGSPPLTGTMSLTIHVTDENDNTPMFEQSTVHVQLARTDLPDTEVYTALATDADSGNNGKVGFTTAQIAGEGQADSQATNGQTATQRDKRKESLCSTNMTVLLGMTLVLVVKISTT